MTLTSVLRPLFTRRADASLRVHADVEQAQRRQLELLLARGRHTAWGRRYGYGSIATYRDFASHVPVTPYDELRPYVMRMVAGERDILWPGVTRRYAQSSGTSDGKSKYIPVTAESLSRNHYRGGREAVAHYLKHHPGSRLFDGAAFILGGSFATEVDCPPGVKVGDLSANLIENINPLVNLLRVPSKQIALMEDWTIKLPALARAAAWRNVTNISGVPSWFLTVLKEVVGLRGASTVKEVWPSLEVFFHGGISFTPYREQYRGLIGEPGINYVETYNASEGFFAVQDDPAVAAMMLMLDAGVFYEFADLDGQNPVPAWEVEQGRVYSLVITACNGLWRYPIGDTVRIESLSPLRVTIAGRTKHFINAFGEELMVHNADRALARACEKHRCAALNYTAAPCFTPDGPSNGCHEWLIEFATPPADTEAFADTLDRALRDENSDYDAKRSSGLFLSRLRLTVASTGAFDRWLASTGKLGGQRKVPRLSNTRTFIDPIKKFCGDATAARQ